MKGARQRAARFDQLHSLIVARDGRIAVGEAFRGPSLERAVNVKSVSKTIVASLVGAALDRGLLDGVDSAPTDPANGRADANADGTPNGLASLLATPGQRDTDRDAVSDFVESAATRTNPFNPDTDGDSLPDGWEIKENLDPNSPSGADGPQGDPDGDGHTNAQEWVLGTRPHTAD